MNSLDAVIDELVERIAARVVSRLHEGQPGWVDQSRSPLGRKHNAAVRRRIASGLPGASRVGRRHLLSPEALTEELQRAAGGTAPTPAQSSNGDVRIELQRELALLKGGRRG